MAEAVASGRMTRNERLVIGYTGLAHPLSHAPEWIYGALLVKVGLTFGITPQVLGSIGTALAVGYGITSLPAGWVSDIMGSRRALVICMGSAAFFCLLVAAAPNTATFTVALTMLGLAAGLYHPSGISFITRSVRSRARALGYHGVTGNVGMALAPLVAAGVAALAHWRISFVVFAGLFLLVAVAVALSRVEETRYAAPRVAKGSQGAAEGGSLKPFLPFLLVIFSVNVLYGFIYRGVTIFLPSHLEGNVQVSFLGVDPTAVAGALTTIALICGSIGQYIGGSLGERFRRERLLVVLAVLVIPALLLTAFTNGAVLVVMASLFIAVNFMAQPTYSTLVADYSPRHLQGRMFGIMFLCIFLLGSLAGVLTGWVAEHYSTDWVFAALASVGTLTVVAALALNGLVARRKVRVTGEVGAGD